MAPFVNKNWFWCGTDISFEWMHVEMHFDLFCVPNLSHLIFTFISRWLSISRITSAHSALHSVVFVFVFVDFILLWVTGRFFLSKQRVQEILGTRLRGSPVGERPVSPIPFATANSEEAVGEVWHIFILTWLNLKPTRKYSRQLNVIASV